MIFSPVCRPSFLSFILILSYYLKGSRVLILNATIAIAAAVLGAAASFAHHQPMDCSV